MPGKGVREGLVQSRSPLASCHRRSAETRFEQRELRELVAGRNWFTMKTHARHPGDASRAETAVRAIVSRGGRPNFAGDALPLVKAPMLLIVGGNDREVQRLNEDAHAQLPCEKKLVLASQWFAQHIGAHR